MKALLFLSLFLSSGCLLVTGYVASRCGDNILDSDRGEQCDDGNTEESNDNGDNCNADCTLPRCGDRLVRLGEQCDDGNFFSGDGCDECQSTAASICGNANQEPGEDCDDGNTLDGDLCPGDCQTCPQFPDASSIPNEEQQAGSCFVLFGDPDDNEKAPPASWKEARDHCTETGGQLATALSQVEHDFIRGLASQSREGLVWIGLNDREEEGTFVWDSGEPLNPAVFFLADDPKNRFNKNCVLVDFEAIPEQSWSPEKCRERASYVCEYPSRR